MKKFIAVLLSLFLFIGMIPCAGMAESKPLTIVTTIFPLYDWARQIAGENENTNLVLLLDNGVDLHSYQPSAQDIMTISTADLFIYVGGESDEWVEDVLESAMNPDLVSISLTEAMGEDLKIEETVEGMEHEHHHDHDHDEEEEHDHEHEEDEHDHEHEDEEHDHDEDHEEEHDHDEGHEEDHDHEEEHDHDHDHEEEEEYDEHVWLSLRNARKLTATIAEALAGIDPDHAETFRANAAAYDEQLKALDDQYTAMTESAAIKTVLFADRFPFRYLTDDYGLTYFAAFSGCSAESEASFETIAFLANKVSELNLPAVLTIESGNRKIADTVLSTANAADRKVLTLNSMQSVTAEDVENGITYLSMMEENLNALKEALN